MCVGETTKKQLQRLPTSNKTIAVCGFNQMTKKRLYSKEPFLSKFHDSSFFSAKETTDTHFVDVKKTPCVNYRLTERDGFKRFAQKVLVHSYICGI